MKPWYNVLIGYTFLILAAVCYMIAVLSAQMIAMEISVLVINLYKYMVEGAICLVVIIYAKLPIKQDLSVGKHLIGAVIAETFFCIPFFLAASLMPVGNNEGTFIAAYVVFATSWDVIKKKISKVTIPCSLVIIVGMVCLIQPWKRGVRKLTSAAPCVCLGNNSMCTGTVNPLRNGTVADDMASLPNQYVGYFLAIIAAFAGTLYNAIVKSAAEKTPLVTFLFWVYVAIVIVFIPLTKIASYFQDIHYSMPVAKYCFIFTLTFILGSGVASILSTFTYKYLPVSAGGQAWPIVTTLLYICQRTFLKRFHPGYSNAIEVSGIVLINIGAILSTTAVSLFETKKLAF